MAGPQALLATAAKEIGTVEVPVNKTKYGRFYGWDGVAWCQIFVWYCLHKSGNGNGGWEKSAWTPDWEAEAKRERRNVSLRNNTIGAEPGMIVHFYSAAKKRIAHVGIIERVVDRHHIITIEGNTSPSRHGSQRNGGQVARRRRYVGPRSSFVASCSMPIWPTGAAIKPDPKSRRTWYVGTSGDQVKTIQRLLGFVGKQVDGVFGGETKLHVRRFQERHGLLVDGVVGNETWAKLEAIGEADDPDVIVRDGSEGPVVKVLQIQLTELGFPLKADGVFGGRTLAAVKGWQAQRGLPETGTVNAVVWKSLAKGA